MGFYSFNNNIIIFVFNTYLGSIIDINVRNYQY